MQANNNINPFVNPFSGYDLNPVKVWTPPSDLFSKVRGQSLGKQPEWPFQRPLILTKRQLAVNNIQILKSDVPNSAGITEIPADGQTVIDVGCGKGQTAMEFKMMRPNVFVIAAGAHDLDDECIKKVNSVYYGCIPDYKQLLTDQVGRAALVMDTYGAVTYHDNPGKALIYETMLLGAGGHYLSVSSTTRDGICESVFGSENNQAAIKTFFLKYFGAHVEMIPTVIESQVNKGTYVTDLLTRFTIRGHDYTTDQYDTICQLFDREVGIPKQGIAWKKFDGSFAINQRIWPKDQAMLAEKAILASETADDRSV